MGKKVERREFMKTGLFSTLAGMTAFHSFFEVSDSQTKGNYDLVAIKDGEPDDMFDKAIESLGGMSKYVKKGQTVVVKPNIGWDVPPERAGNTNPKLVKRIIEHCFKSGAKDVYVFDHTCDDWNNTYKTSGIEKAVKDAGGKIVSGGSEKYYVSIKVPKGKVLKEDKIHELIINSDVFINVPVLKNHGSAKLTIAMKNLMGINWDRRYWHKNDLHQCIADLTTRIKPDLNVVDAYRVMQTHGPRGISVDDILMMKAQIISSDIVACDAAATKMFGLEPDNIPHIKYAHDMGVGNMNLDKLKIHRIKM